jgi:hypothetical protein
MCYKAMILYFLVVFPVLSIRSLPKIARDVKTNFVPLSESWVDNFKDGIVRKHVKLAEFEGKLRGIVATDLIPPEPVVFVSADVALEVTNDRPPSPFPDFVPDELWSKCMWDQRLSLKLVSEVKNVTSTSKIAWITELPTVFSTPFHWTEESLVETQYPTIEKKVTIQKESWKSFYKRWQSATDLKYKNLITEADLYRALECCNSRAFSGPYEGSSPRDRFALLSFTGILSVLWPLLHFTSFAQSVGLGVTIGLSVILRDFFLSNFANLKRYVLCPYVDMFNHHSSAVSDVSFNYFKNRFELIVKPRIGHPPYSPGDQVFISYGRPSNDRLLQFYGFVETNNPYDLYDYGKSVLELLLLLGDTLATVVDFPTNPLPSERLQYIATAVQNTDVMLKRANDKSELNMMLTSLSAGKLDDSALDLRYYRTSLRPIELSTQSHYDDISVRCLRLFFATEIEWNLSLKSSSQNVDLDCVRKPLSMDTELRVQKCLQEIARLELTDKTTTLEQDQDIIRYLSSSGISGSDVEMKSSELKLAVEFRIEKKKMLLEAMNDTSS